MKKIVALMCAAALMFVVAGCAARGIDKKELQLSEYDGIAVNELVQMFIKQKTVTDATEELTLWYENLSDKEFTFDAGARLEMLVDGSWYLIPAASDAMTMAIYHLPAGGSEEGSFVLAGNYEKLSEGSYRIVKLFTDADGVMTVAAAEFNIGRG